MNATESTLSPADSTLSPHLLVAYVSAAASQLVETGQNRLEWAIDEAVGQLEAEQVRLLDTFGGHHTQRVAALSRELGPVLEFSDLVLRAIAGSTEDQQRPSDASISPSVERAERIESLASVVEALKQAASGDPASALVVRDVFAQATDLVVGRAGQADLV